MKSVLMNPEVLETMRQNLVNYQYQNRIIINQFNQLVEGKYVK